MSVETHSPNLLPLRAVLESASLDAAGTGAVDRAQLLLAVADAIRQLHDAGFVHRAIGIDEIRCHPGNLTVALASAPDKVAFGGPHSDVERTPPALRTRTTVELPPALTEARQILDRAGIACTPEQIDLYQFATLACRVLTGDSVAAYLRSSKTKSQIPPPLRNAIDRALGFNPEQEIRTARELVDALSSVRSQTESHGGGPAAALAPSGDTDVSVTSAVQDTPRPPVFGAAVPSAPTPSDALPWATLGHYQIVRRIGHGGMGDVYLGYERQLDRHVAIKVLPTELARESEFVRRFYAEASAAARVVHPHIIPIHNIGEDAGQHFFVMQYVEGESLAALLRRRGRLSVDEALDLLDQILSGLEAAHAQGLIHRDIKPGNILLDQSGRHALLADFGLAKSLRTDATGHTATGVVMGTVDYLSPEQGRGRSVDHRSDLYSVGVLAYQMLSGRLPFTADSPTALIFQHVYERPKPLSAEAEDVPAALSAVVAKLLAKSPDSRHASAAAVRADLHAARQGVPLPSGADSALARDPEAFSRPSAAAGPATLLIHAPTFVSDGPIDEAELEGPPPGWLDKLGGWLGFPAPRSADWLSNTQLQVDGVVAEYERRRDRLAGLAREAQSALEELGAQEAAWRGSDVRAGDTALRTVAELQEARQAQEAQLETMRVRLAQVNARLEQLRAQRHVLNARLQAAQAWLPAQRHAVGRRLLRSWRLLAMLFVLGLSSVVLIRLVPRPMEEPTQAGTTAGGGLAGASGAPAPYVPAPGQSPAAVAAAALARGVNRDNWTGLEKHLAISRDGTRLISSFFDPNRDAGSTCEIKLWDLESKRELRTMSAPHRSFSLRLSADAGLLVSAGLAADGGQRPELKVWDTATGDVVRVIPAEFDPIKADVAISAASKTASLLLTGSSGTLGSFDLTTGVVEPMEMPLSQTATSLASTPDGGIAAVAVYQDGTDAGRTAIDIYDLETRRMLTSVPTDGITRHLNFSADGRWLMAIGRAIYLWNTSHWELKQQFPYAPQGLVTTSVSSDGAYVAVLKVGKISVWNTSNGSVRELATNENCLDLAFATGTTLVVASPHSPFMVFDAATGRQQLMGSADLSEIEPMWRTQVDVRPLWTVRMDQPATGLAVSGNDGVVSIAAAGRIKTLSAISGDVLDEQATDPAFGQSILSSDGRRLAGIAESSSAARDVLIWDSQATTISSPTGAAAAGTPLGFVDHDRTLLLAVPHDDHQELVFWNLSSNTASRKFMIPAPDPGSLAVHPSGAFVAVTSPAGTISLLRLGTETESGDPVQQPFSVRGRVLGFHPSEPWLLLRGEQDTLAAYEIDTQRRVAMFHTRDGPVQQVVFDRTGRRCATVGDSAVRVWDLSLGYLRLVVGIQAVTAAAFSSDGQRLAVCDASAQLHLIDTSFPSIHVDADQWISRVKSAGTEVWRFLPEQARYDPKSATTPDGRMVARINDGLLQLLDAHDGRVLHDFSGVRMVESIAVSPDGRVAASAGYDGDSRQGDIRLWNLRSGRELRRFRGHVHYGWSVDFSADGRRLLTGGTGVMHLWDVDTGEEIQTFSTPFSYVTKAAFSRDGRWAVASDAVEGRPCVTSVFEIGSGAELVTLQGGYAELVLEDTGLVRDRSCGELRYTFNVP